MGQAKLRGTRDERIAQAVKKMEEHRPEKLICNSCQADVQDIHPVSTRGLRGIEAIWMGQCQCGHTTFAAAGDPNAVQAFFDALGDDVDLSLGRQTKDGSDHEQL